MCGFQLVKVFLSSYTKDHLYLNDEETSLSAFSDANDHYCDNEIGICAMIGTALVDAFFSAPLFFVSITKFAKKTKNLSKLL